MKQREAADGRARQPETPEPIAEAPAPDAPVPDREETKAPH
ncbi:MAG: hypothetical protein WC285_04555 [Candidatus Gracilibacteria bacterium]